MRSRTVAFGTLLASFAACSSRDKAPPSVERPADASVPPRLSHDAAAPVPALGPYDSVRARFESDCPLSLPRRKAASGLPSLDINSSYRRCTQVVRGKGARAVQRLVTVDHAEDDSQPDPADVRVPIARVAVEYEWHPTANSAARPRECTNAIGDVLPYLRDLTGISAQEQAQVSLALQAHQGRAIRFVVFDRDVCAVSFELISLAGEITPEGDGLCGAHVYACQLLLAPTVPPVDVVLTTYQPGDRSQPSAGDQALRDAPLTLDAGGRDVE